MKISESIVKGILSGGSLAPAGSAPNRTWNRAWERFFKTCADHLLGYLVRKYPNLNHADAEDVIGPALMRTYKSLKEQFDPEKDKIESWIFTDTTRKAIDLLRKKGRISRLEAVSLDASIDDESDIPLSERIGAEDSGFEAMEQSEVRNLRKDQMDEALSELEAQGKCKREKIEIFKATQSGEKPDDIATRFDVKRAYVDSTKNEITGRLIFIAQHIVKGVALKEAVAQSKAKNKSGD